ncbi:hypothetical protein [Cohnella cholangitidis]|uniref:Uncharacterized protein n=1 Tax=Cohnella cholangitidis TaxID=2598458 RepID=A0A7G5C382_9BACL|nr:hypothetical protein [Cohnella cholangitidis]QMV43666.1 hypothetical protein FPL14_22680 [Cohnella cholangitidis]
MNRSNQTPGGSYSFHVEINVSASSKGAALVQLRQVLSNADFENYKIISTLPAESDNVPASAPSAPKKAAKNPSQPDPLETRIRQYIESNKLIRLNVNKGLGVKMSIPCRVINFDPSNQLLTVYHVDEKQVYSVVLNEIDDFVD